MPADLHKARELFLHAVGKLSPEEWDGYVAETCGGDGELLQQVGRLLQVHREAGSFLNVPAVEQIAAGLPQPDEATVAMESNAEGAAIVAPREDRPDQAVTQDERQGDHEEIALDFLQPSTKPGSLGRLGHYEVLEVIGRGGMGVVLRAFDDKLHRVVAIKVMAAPLATSATARQRFAREAQAQAAVSHEHVVAIHAVEEANGLPYLVMQYVAGVSLQERLDRSGPLQLKEILRIGLQTACGLAAAHAQGLIHRDVKPSNILLENGVERVKITDFGLARAVDDASLTQSGIIAGTPQYMAPEQARGEVVDHRADLFSLGSVLYALCTGRPSFRASGTMAVLKRVCEDTPRPIQEINPETPDWLVAIVAKLQAKHPLERFQSAAEVAELLGRHLAHLQQPALPPMPVVCLSETPVRDRRVWVRSRRWAAAAALLLLLIGVFSVTEAAGVTKVAATVIRVFTPEGTLVVEVDDPSVKVTIEGDGGIAITGAGPQEVRLRPGSYKLHADRDGKPVPLERELVSIAKGGWEVVRVKLEATQALESANVEKGAFVLLTAGKERRFDALAEAVIGANDGEVIEIRSNGPFVINPIAIRGTALTIRASQGFRPVLRLESGERVQASLLHSDSLLVLEGLELQRLGEQSPGASGQVLFADQAPLYLGNCRLFMSQGLNAVTSIRSPRCILRNCELVIPVSGGVDWFQPSRGELAFDNCLVLSPPHLAVAMHYREPSAEEPLDVSVRLGRNTWVCGGSLMLFCHEMKAGASLRPIRVETAANLFDVGRRVLEVTDCRPDQKPLSRADAQTFLAQLLTWRGRENVYPAKLASWVWWPGSVSDKPAVNGVTEWGEFWGNGETGSSEARTRYDGGDLRSKGTTSPQSVAPEDFRLRSDSAGYRAGKDGKDLGADVDLVGPGQAYERWKKTPDYQQWLKDTGQVKK